MTNYSGSEAYDFSLFEDEGVSYAARQSNAAPKLPEQPQPDTRQIPEPAQLAPKRKANPQPAQEKRHSLLQVLTAVLMSVLVLAGSGILLNRRAEMDGIAASINEINEKIALEESDHVRLLSELNSMFSKTVLYVSYHVPAPDTMGRGHFLPFFLLPFTVDRGAKETV